MGAASWAHCPECKVQLKEDKLDAHRKRVHPKGARTPEQAQHHRRRQATMKKAAFAILALIAIAAVVVAATQIPNLGTPAGAEPAAEGRPYLGDPEAPVTAYYFGDHQCPSCAHFELAGALAHLEENHIEPGQVRLVVKSFPIVGSDSYWAAQASYAVWQLDPDAWHEWNQFVFMNQGQGQSGWASQHGITQITASWGGVSMDGFSSLLDVRQVRDLVREDERDAQRLGIASTPSLYIDGQRVNANDVDAVDTAIEQALGRLSEVQ